MTGSVSAGSAPKVVRIACDRVRRRPTGKSRVRASQTTTPICARPISRPGTTPPMKR